MSDIKECAEYSENESETAYSNIGQISPSRYVGFSQFIDQYVLYHSHMGFTFNILCVGKVGIGKTTFINSLFQIKEESEQIEHISGISQRNYTLYEQETKLHLNIFETIDYGKGVDGDDWSLVCSFLDNQHLKYLDEEMNVNRPSPNFKDPRIHCCFYFISPNTRNLCSVDVLSMSNMATRVNLVPIIAKSDTLTKKELTNLKSSVLDSLKSANIQIFSFLNLFGSLSLNDFVPFAVVGSMDQIKVGKKIVLGRQYPWGAVEVENETHCDFVQLREAVVRTNMEELIDSTNKFFEVYRSYKLEEFGCQEENPLNLNQIYTEKKNDLMDKIQLKKSNLKKLFVQKIKNKEIELDNMEKDMREKYRQVEVRYEEESKLLDCQFEELDEEIQSFNKLKIHFEGKKKKKE